jgi:hypothetical protein
MIKTSLVVAALPGADATGWSQAVCEIGDDSAVQLGCSFSEKGVLRLGPLTIACEPGAIAGQVWGAGCAFAQYLLTSEGALRVLGRVLHGYGLDVVELGSGTGIVGLACAVAGAGSVLLTDLPEHCDRLKANIVLNELGSCVEARPLPWGDLDAVYEAVPNACDIIIGADLCYNMDLFDALLATVHELAQIKSAKIFIATEQRWDNVDAAWDAALLRSGLEVVDQWELRRSARLLRPVKCVELRVRDE